MPSIANNSFKHYSFHDVTAQGCSLRTRPPRSTLLQQFCQSNSGFMLSACNWEKAKHMGLRMSKCGVSTLNLFLALTWSASSPRSHPKGRSIATPALKPKAPAHRWNLAGEYASANATESAPSAPASRMAYCTLSSVAPAMVVSWLPTWLAMNTGKTCAHSRHVSFRFYCTCTLASLALLFQKIDNRLFHIFGMSCRSGNSLLKCDPCFRILDTLTVFDCFVCHHLSLPCRPCSAFLCS